MKIQWVAFTIGFFLGGLGGVASMCLCLIAKTAQNKENKMKNILLVDDDASCLYLLERILESSGFRVTKAANGVEAVNILKKLKFDVMITDFHMPGMNGIQLAKKVKELHTEMVIIMVTAGWLPDVVEAAANASISQILSKPFNVKQLLANIKLAEGVLRTSDPNLHIEDTYHGRVRYDATAR